MVLSRVPHPGSFVLFDRRPRLRPDDRSGTGRASDGATSLPDTGAPQQDAPDRRYSDHLGRSRTRNRCEAPPQPTAIPRVGPTRGATMARRPSASRMAAPATSQTLHRAASSQQSGRSRAMTGPGLRSARTAHYRHSMGPPRVCSRPVFQTESRRARSRTCGGWRCTTGGCGALTSVRRRPTPRRSAGRPREQSWRGPRGAPTRLVSSVHPTPTRCPDRKPQVWFCTFSAGPKRLS